MGCCWCLSTDNLWSSLKAWESMSTLTSPNKAFMLLIVSLLMLKTFCMDVCPILQRDFALIIEILWVVSWSRMKFGHEITSGQTPVNWPAFSVCRLIQDNDLTWSKWQQSRDNVIARIRWESCLHTQHLASKRGILTQFLEQKIKPVTYFLSEHLMCLWLCHTLPRLI